MKAVAVIKIVLVLMAGAEAMKAMPHFPKKTSKTAHLPPEMKFLPKEVPNLRGTISVPFKPVIAKSQDMLVSNFQASRVVGNGFRMDGATMGATLFAVVGGLFIVLQVIMTCCSSLRKSDTPLDNSKAAPKASCKALTEIDLETVKSMPVYSIFDCFLMQPQEEITPVRLQGRIVASSGSIKSPIAGEDCVFSSTLAQQDGLKVRPVELNKQSFDFELDLSNRMRVRIRGDEVTLFCMNGGNGFRKDMSQADPAFSKLSGSTVFQFMERCLRVGAVVTCVGKLRYVEKDNWELVPCNIGGEGQAETVWVSDNLTLESPGLPLTPRESPREYDVP